MADIRIEQLRELLPRCLLPDWVRLGSRLVRLLRDQRHPASHDALLDRLLTQAQASIALRERRARHVPLPTYPADLPISPRKDEIVAAIRNHPVVVIAGETGSGKTTQIPKMCLEAGLGIEAKIGCTQPRRVAALSISRRVAEELGVEWGREVGCKIRFDDRSSGETYIKMMTDGILLAETQGDPLLAEYNALIIDEAHERSLNIDFLLGYLKGLLARRSDLKLIITSATIDTQAFSAAFGGAPILEVSGRLYPVETLYAPLDAASEESGELTIIDAAVRAVQEILRDSGGGDVLIFMPGERDIRETSDLLDDRFGQEVDVIPLFGRLSAGDQQRVFAPCARRKIVVATNIAETSLTIPGIHYVIDSGLARISRYNPRTRTRRLPVEPISQSSANQRAGRSGRVRNGVCIRLYSEEDFQARAPFTQPEIQRANLAEVILRMKAFRLGEIESFPFLNPPTPAAIQGGYQLLQELGALGPDRELTPLGRDLARLPIDPTLGRMLLQSQHEHATRELLIIAAGLSIQDPRERPLDQKDAAAAAHKRFQDPGSDFITLLNVWNAVHDQWETLRTQNQRRKFCRAHFLSYQRMREWQDLHAQLHGALEDLGSLRLNESNAASDAIHRCILTGLLAHVGLRTERNLYRTSSNRPVNLFPGSTLFDRHDNPKAAPARQGPAKSKPPPTRQPAWIVAGEIVETSQVFARTAAGINPEWLLELAPHLCRSTHARPQWSAPAGRVLVEETISFGSLEVRRRRVAYGNINPTEATEIFIRAALVEEDLLPAPHTSEEQDADPPSRPGTAPRARVDRRSGHQAVRVESVCSAGTPRQGPHVEERAFPGRYQFIEHNRRLKHKIATWQTRVRRHDLPDLDEGLFRFYRARLENISSLDELNRWLGAHAGPGVLCATERDLAGDPDLTFDRDAFPDSVTVGSQPVALAYAYAPGEERDGVTVRLPLEVARSVSPASVEWAVPGLRAEMIQELLRALPKSIRRELMPLPPKVAEIVKDFSPAGRSLLEELARFLHQRYGVTVTASAWPADPLPQHLRPRVAVLGDNEKTLGTGRDLEQLRAQLEKARVSDDLPAWTAATQRWERFGLGGWTFGDLPERITVDEGGGLPLYAWPGLQVEEQNVHLRLFRTRDTARASSVLGVRELVQKVLQRELAWVQKDLQALSRHAPICNGWMSADDLVAGAFEHIRRQLAPAEPLAALTELNFQQAVARARELLPGLATQLVERVGTILKLRQEVHARCRAAARPAAGQRLTLAEFKASTAAPLAARAPYGTMAADLAELLPPNFLETIPSRWLPEVPRYLKAMLLRAERAGVNPPKDVERAGRVAPYVEQWRKLNATIPPADPARADVDELRWMIEEFKVSLFAQELGTAFPISAKRLDERLEKLRR